MYHTSPTGIRSQSKPQDIMGEVYKAMMSLGYVSCIRLGKLACKFNMNIMDNKISFFRKHRVI